MNGKQLKQEKKKESEIILNGIIQLKNELLPKLNSIYKECLDNEEVNINFKTSFKELDSRHIEFLALTHLKRLLNNPSSVDRDIKNILAASEDTRQYETGHSILIGLNAIGLYEEDL